MKRSVFWNPVPEYKGDNYPQFVTELREWNKFNKRRTKMFSVVAVCVIAYGFIMLLVVVL